MKLKTFPKEVACELLVYMAEKEDFSAVCESLGGEVSGNEVKALLREIAAQMQNELKVELGESYDVRKCKYLTDSSKEILSYLSPHEEKKLLKAFGLLEKK